MAQTISGRERAAPKTTALPSTPAPDALSVHSEKKARVRKPFGSHSQKLAYPQREGYHRHWFNHTPGRITDALAAGYEHVKDEDGENVKRVVGVTEAGQPMEGFLMEIPQEWYDEDMAEQQRIVTERENAMKRGNTAGKVGVDGVYVPSRGISIRTA